MEVQTKVSLSVDHYGCEMNKLRHSVDKTSTKKHSFDYSLLFIAEYF